MSIPPEQGKILRCPFGTPAWCEEICALYDHDDDCCCLRVLTRALEDLASEYHEEH